MKHKKELNEAKVRWIEVLNAVESDQSYNLIDGGGQFETGIIPWNKGGTIKDEIRQQVSKSLKEYYDKHGIPDGSKATQFKKRKT